MNMIELFQFLQVNFKTITTLLTASIVAEAVYLYSNRHHRYGYKIGKSVASRLKNQINNILTDTESKGTTPDRVKSIKDMVFQAGLSICIEDLDKRKDRLNDQVNSAKQELAERKEVISKECQEKNRKIEESIQELKAASTIKEKELSQLKTSENEKNEILKENHRIKNQNKYFFSELTQKIRGSLFEATQKLEMDTLHYVYVVVILLLLAGDYYISYFILSDVLRIQFKDNQIAIYIFSGIFALVFLVLIDRAIDFLESSSIFKKHLKKVQMVFSLVIGLILLAVYVLLVSLSLIKENNIIVALDTLLRLLFVPIVIAVALTIRKVQKKHGFSFIFTPFKVILYLTLLILFNLMFIFGVIFDFISGYFQKEKLMGKSNLIVIAEENQNIKTEIAQKQSLIEASIQQCNLEINRLTERYQRLINKLNKKLDDLSSETSKIKKGCENGVVNSLRLV